MAGNIKRPYGFVKWDPRDAEDLRGAQNRTAGADPGRRPSLLRRARLRGGDRREARGGDRPLPRRDLQLLPLQGGPVRRARRPRQLPHVGGLGRTRGSRRSCARSSSWTPPGSRSTSSSPGAARTDPEFWTIEDRRRSSCRRTGLASRRRSAPASSVTISTPKEIGTFVNLVLNGLAFLRAGGEEVPHAPNSCSRCSATLSGGARPGTPSRTRA